MLTFDDIIYMIVTDRFARPKTAGGPALGANPDPAARHGGNLAGIIERLPYLKSLGVTVLWMTPVYVNPPGSYHGYHPLDFENVDPSLCGGENDGLGGGKSLQGREPLRRFVEAAHAQGMKVMLDVIVSHLAENHPWLKERPQWINFGGQGVEKEWFKNLPNLNHDNLDTNVYFVLNTLDWIAETGVDAIRIDAARHVESRFWEHLKLYTHAFAAQASVVGEFWDGSPHCLAPYQNQHGFDGMFDFPLYHAIRDVFIDDHPFAQICRPGLWGGEQPGILDLDPLYRNANQLITFIGNHDTPRFFESAAGPARPDDAVRRMKLASVFVMTSRGIPQIYYGDELAMGGGMDPDNRRDMRWDWVEAGSANATADRARANEMLEFTRRLVALRQASPALRWGLRATLYVTPKLLAYMRFSLDDAVVVCLNNDDAPADVAVPVRGNAGIASALQDKFADGLEFADELGGRKVKITDGRIPLTLPARSAAIYRVRLPARLGPARKMIDDRQAAKARPTKA